MHWRSLKGSHFAETIKPPKDFNQANGYLIHKFGEVVAQIERLNIERIEGEKLQGQAMSKTAFILTAGYHVFDDAFMPIVIAMGESEEAILNLHHTYTLQENSQILRKFI